MYIQEGADINAGKNYTPISQRYSLPNQRGDTTVFLLSNSYEYDIELIKNMPAPRNFYQKIIIPSQFNDKIGVKSLKYQLSKEEYGEQLLYLNEQKTAPKIMNIRPPYPTKFTDNVYVSLSGLVSKIDAIIKMTDTKYLSLNISNMFNQIINHYNFTKNKILIIDTDRYELYQNYNKSTYNGGLINSLLSAYIINPESIVKSNCVIIFRNKNSDYKMDLRNFKVNDINDLKSMLRDIGRPNLLTAKNDDEAEESVNDFDKQETDDTNETESVDTELNKHLEDKGNIDKSAKTNIRTTIDKLSEKYNVNSSSDNEDNSSTEDSNNKKLYNAKSLNVNASLLKTIDASDTVISNYEKLAADLTQTGDNPVEDKLINDASKKLSTIVKPIDTVDSLNTISSPRELKIRSSIGQLKLKNVDVDTLNSVVDVPLPEPMRPLKITTTNPGASQGSSFPQISKVYEEKMMDQDIVSIFMNLDNLPNGYYVKDVEVTDISTVTTLMNNWRVTLIEKTSNLQSVINVHIPKVFNSRFFNNGRWYNIGKQDFPIPILKVNKKKVMLTSCSYNKMTIERYDTRSLTDINMIRKLLTKIYDKDGSYKYIKTGNSVNTNSRYVSTIEYDEFAKQWYSFINKEVDCEIYFSRVYCEKQYAFVTTQDNEFCCGMINKVPIVINTETGLTRQNTTLTDLILSTLPEEHQKSYYSMKPAKLSMYSEITIGMKIPLGVAVAAWEGISSLLKKCKCKYQYVEKSFADTKYFTIPFKDKILAIENSTPNQLLFNGFYRINTKAYTIADFENPIMSANSVYVDIFNQIFFKRYQQLTLFINAYNFFIDPITSEVCQHYNLPTDICSLMIYASNILADNNFRGEGNASLYRIRSTEIIPAILHFTLAAAISKKTNVLGSKSRSSSIQYNPNSVIAELIKVPNVSLMSALNPITELNSQENITKKGYVGLNSDRAYTLDKRAYNDSMIGKFAISSPNNANVGVNRQLVIDPNIESLRGYTKISNDDSNNDLQLASFSELLTPGTVTRDDAIRNAIATSQTSHIVPTDGAQPVIISNGVDEIVPSYLSDEFTVSADEDGKVLEITDGYMIVEYKSGKKRAINIDNRYSLNTGSGNYVNNKLLPNFNVNDQFKKGDVLAYHEKHFTKDPTTGTVRMNIGPMLKICFASTSDSYEDGGFITRKGSEAMKTSLTNRQLVKIKITDDIDKLVKVGDEVEINDPLIVFGVGDTGDKAVDNFLKAFQDKSSEKSMLDSAKRTVKAKYAGRVADVRMYTVKSLDKLSPSLFELFDEYFKTNKKKRKILDKYDKTNSVYKMETLFALPTEPLKGSTIMGITADVIIEIYIEHEDELSVGDKAVAYGAAKQINSTLVPDGLEPYSEYDPTEEVSMTTEPTSTLKRMIPSLIITALGNKAAINLKKQMLEIWNE